MDDILRQFRDDHHQFDLGRLEDHVGNEPFTLLRKWLEEAKSTAAEPNAMVISTVDAQGKPHSRIVYLKEEIAETFVFYTNYNSDKGKDILQNPNVHLMFFWPELERQLNISGRAEKVAEAMSDAYFASRPRMSRLGAWASNQSERLEAREVLEKRLQEFSERFPDEVPRPSHWGGYQVIPEAIEFWQGRPSRLHDRIRFEKEGGNWLIYRKNP